MQWISIHVPMQGHRFDPWSGKIPHATEQLSPCAKNTDPVFQSLQAATTEPTRLEPVLSNKISHRNEKPTHQNEEEPLFTATRESLHKATKIEHSQEKKFPKSKKNKEMGKEVIHVDKEIKTIAIKTRAKNLELAFH